VFNSLLIDITTTEKDVKASKHCYNHQQIFRRIDSGSSFSKMSTMCL